MADIKSVTVHIYGNEYTLKGEADPKYISELAKFVDAKMADIGRKSSAPAAKVAILAAMNIADEYHRMEKAKGENLKLIETLEKNLLEMKRSQDGSLRHSLEMKEQLDRYKAEAGDKTQLIEEAAKARVDLEETKKKISMIESDFLKAQETVVELKKQAEKAQLTLDSQKTQEEEKNKEINELKITLGETKAEMQKNREDMEKVKEELVKAQKELDLSQNAKGKSDKDAEQLLEELEKAQKELKDAQIEMEKLKTAQPKGPSVLKSPAELEPPPSFPTNEKLQALFRKIDAILE